MNENINTEKAMTALNAARKAMGFARQGLTCSPVNVRNTLRQLEREVGAEAMPRTFALFNEMLTNGGKAPEKAALESFDEINKVRGQVRGQRDAEIEADAHQATLTDNESGQDDAPGMRM